MSAYYELYEQRGEHGHDVDDWLHAERELRGAVMRTIQDVLHRLRAEYTEMPGLRLNAQQVQRLCGIEQTMCQLALDALVAEKFLCAKADGHYARLTEGPYTHPAQAD